MKLQRLTSSATPTPASEQALAKKYLNLYLEALPLGEDLPETTLHPADDLAVLASEALISAFHSSPTAPNPLTDLLNTLPILELAVSTSKYGYAARFLLLRMYRLLGAPSLAMTHYRQANLKGIQHDTLSHNILNRAADFSLGSSGDLTFINECIEASTLYSVNSSDVRCPFLSLVMRLLIPPEITDG